MYRNSTEQKQLQLNKQKDIYLYDSYNNPDDPVTFNSDAPVEWDSIAIKGFQNYE